MQRAMVSRAMPRPLLNFGTVTAGSHDRWPPLATRSGSPCAQPSVERMFFSPSCTCIRNARPPEPGHRISASPDFSTKRSGPPKVAGSSSSLLSPVELCAAIPGQSYGGGVLT